MNMCKRFVELVLIGLIDTPTVCHFSAVAIDDHELEFIINFGHNVNVNNIERLRRALNTYGMYTVYCM